MPSENRITSPEQLNNYIRVTKPGVWIVLSAVLVFLAGFMIWIFTGELELSFESHIYTEGSESRAFLTYDKLTRLQKGMTVRIADSKTTGTIKNLSHEMIPYDEIINLIGENNSILMAINEHDKLFPAEIEFTDAPQNVSRAVFITGTFKPVHFLLK